MATINLKDNHSLSEAEVSNHAYHIKTRGYSIIPNFLNNEECALLKTGIVNGIANYKPTPGVERSHLDRHQMHDLLNRDANFGHLLEDTRLQQLISPHLGEHWIMYAASSSSIPPNGKNYASRLHVDSPRYHPGYVFNMGFIWTLDDYIPETGALKFLPGSQHSDKRPDLDFFEKNCIQITCEAGSAVIFNAKTYHRTCSNSTNEWNHSMTLNACRSFMKQRMDWVKFIPNEISQQLNTQAKRLIGFDTRVPSSLEDFFLSDDERLYKPNQG